MEQKKLMPVFNKMPLGAVEAYPLTRLLTVRNQAANWNAMNAASGLRLRCEVSHTCGVVNVYKEEKQPKADAE